MPVPTAADTKIRVEIGISSTRRAPVVIATGRQNTPCRAWPMSPATPVAVAIESLRCWEEIDLHASNALDRGVPAHLVQQTLGHSSLAVTSVYAHARPADSPARFLVV